MKTIQAILELFKAQQKELPDLLQKPHLRDCVITGIYEGLKREVPKSFITQTVYLIYSSEDI